MKIYINRKPVQGPWGGGSKFLLSLERELASSGFEISYSWKDIASADLIYCHDPRPNDEGVWFQDFINAKLKYGIPILQRVGDTGSHGKKDLTELVRASTAYSDFVIFPSKWAKEYVGFSGNNCSIINNSPLEDFYKHRKLGHTLSEPIRIVTHHWSDNEKKGFETYRELASFCQANPDKYQFSYIGRFRHPLPDYGMTYFEPMDTGQISAELPLHDVYITASLEEAGANHVLEAMACGLPVLFHEGGGSINEYCSGYGLSYSCFDSLIKSLDQLILKYHVYTDAVKKYNRVPHDMSIGYVDIARHIIGKTKK
tara:strand:- start:2225 stop:3163 length:939 start_codon:yes stop_codon:yes gene_type:complete